MKFRIDKEVYKRLSFKGKLNVWIAIVFAWFYMWIKGYRQK